MVHCDLEVEFVSNLYREDGHQVIQCNIRDITERKQAEEALREADRRKDEFLAMLAHELRNPLAPILNAVHLLQRLGPDEPHLARAREVIERQTIQQAHLLDDLLDVSRITRGKILLRPERLDLARLVRDATEDCRSLLEEAGVGFTVELPEEPVWVEGDPTRLAQAALRGGGLRPALDQADRFHGTGTAAGGRSSGPGGIAALRGCAAPALR